MPTPTNGSTDEETSKPSTRAPTSVGSALAKAKELRDAGQGAEAEQLLEDFFAREATEKEEAKKQAHIASQNLTRLEGKKERHARTHVEKVIPRPWLDPIFLKHCAGKTLTAALMTKLGKIGISEAGADFGPVPDGFRNVPQKGSYSPPRTVIASWVEAAFLQPMRPLEAMADEVGLRVEQKIDNLMLTHREYVVRVIHIVAYMMLATKMGEEAARAAMEKDFEWLTVFDPAAVLSGAGETESAPDDTETNENENESDGVAVVSPGEMVE